VDHIKRYWVGFNLVKGIGAVRLQKLLDVFGDAQKAWDASPAQLRSAGLGQSLVDSLVKVRARTDLDRVWSELEAGGVQVLTWGDERYPGRLKEIDYPPPVLYMKGELFPQDDEAVAVVGTRRMTSYGRRVTEELVHSLVQHGLTVVSGLARGIDTIAHRCALEAGGRTLAVLGSGIDRLYPAENRRLAQSIQSNGAVLSDYAPGTPPEASNFPPRNRIISGLSRAVVVVEAGEKSGALITASFAADQGREVFSVPGNIYAVQSKGTNRLLQLGAAPMLATRDLLDELDLDLVVERLEARAALPADAVETRLLEAIGPEPIHIDEISTRTALSAPQISSTLSMMELKGLVRQVGGQRFVALHGRHQGNRLR
jgi:DNA processing protein